MYVANIYIVRQRDSFSLLKVFISETREKF
jgi:hypothetical protein